MLEVTTVMTGTMSQFEAEADNVGSKSSTSSIVLTTLTVMVLSFPSATSNFIVAILALATTAFTRGNPAALQRRLENFHRTIAGQVQLPHFHHTSAVRCSLDFCLSRIALGDGTDCNDDLGGI